MIGVLDHNQLKSDVANAQLVHIRCNERCDEIISKARKMKVFCENEFDNRKDIAIFLRNGADKVTMGLVFKMLDGKEDDVIAGTQKVVLGESRDWEL